jgi:hypothetical protein
MTDSVSRAPEGEENDLVTLSQGLFSDENILKYKDMFSTAKPYTHVVLQDLCDPAVLKRARQELIENVEAKYKETDLFKVLYHFQLELDTSP